MAAAASSSDEYSTKAKPRGRPVMRSEGRKTSTIEPACANNSSIWSLVVLNSRLPTNTLELTGSLSAGCAQRTRMGRRQRRARILTDSSPPAGAPSRSTAVARSDDLGMVVADVVGREAHAVAKRQAAEERVRERAPPRRGGDHVEEPLAVSPQGGEELVAIVRAGTRPHLARRLDSLGEAAAAQDPRQVRQAQEPTQPRLGAQSEAAAAGEL